MEELEGFVSQRDSRASEEEKEKEGEGRVKDEAAV